MERSARRCSAAPTTWRTSRTAPRRSRPRSTRASSTAPRATTAARATAATARRTTCSRSPSGSRRTPRPTQRVVDSIAADVRAKGDTLNTGVLGTKYLLPVLTEHGHADLAYTLATQTKYPSWGFMIENGATSMWEHWALAARSRGHYFLGTVDDWFFHHVGGHPDDRRLPLDHDRAGGHRRRAGVGAREHAHAVRAGHERLAQAATARSTLRVDVPVGSIGDRRRCRPRTWHAVTEGGRPVAEADGVRLRARRGCHGAREGRLGPLRVRLRRADGRSPGARSSGSTRWPPRCARAPLRREDERRLQRALDDVEARPDEGAQAAALAATSTRAAEALARSLDALGDFDADLRRRAARRGRPGDAGRASAPVREALGGAISDYLAVRARPPRSRPGRCGRATR